ncbi:phage tail tape measure protein [Amycolatopsis sp. CFH S0078]|uniref:phage tail tape measure protein n=1 Tax=Amycolatopsis sp. CFH S0078 TaxID=1644108 RepID=UPI00106E436F|nr:phage tail tape measure protein [Amycolatopsis sp. CFH S0078]
MSESVIADLMVVLSTKADTAIAGFTEVSAAGEEMSAKIATATAAVSAETDRMAESVAAAGASIDTTAATMGTQLRVAQGRFVAAGASAQDFGAQTTTASEEVSASSARMAGALERIGIASETAATENKLAAEQMAAQTAALSAKMELAAGKAAASNERVSASISKLGEDSKSKNKQVAKDFGMVAVAAAGVGVVALDMAGKYEQSTNKLVTSAGESKDAIEQVRQGMLSMAGEVGVSAEQLSDAMYKVESAGYHGAAGLGLLKAAEQGAKAEGADGAKVADALSSAMRDYYPHAQSAADVTKYSTDVMSKLIGATSAGKMTFDELSGSLNSILPVASAAHISLDDVLGVLSSMTVHGISAEQATQNMADAIRHLQAPTQTMSKAMATLGIDSQDVAQKLGQRGLSGTMQYLSDAVKKAMPPGSEQVLIQLGNAASKSSPQVQDLANKVLNGSITMGEFTKAAKGLDPISAKQAQSFATLAAGYHQLGNQQMSGTQVMATYGGQMQKLMGDATGLKVALMTTGENAEYTAGAIKTIAGSTADAKGNVKGWQEVQESFNQKLAETKASLGALAINLGNALLPIVKPVVDKFAEFAHWLSENPTVAKIAAIAIAALAAGFTALAVAMWAASATPVSLIIGAVVAGVVLLIAGITALVTHWKQVWSAVGSALHAVYSAVIKPVIDAIVAAAKAVGAAFSWLWNTLLKPVFNAISVAVRAVAMVIADVLVIPVVVVIKILGAIFKWLWDNAIKPVVDAVGTAMHWLYDNVFKPVGDAIGVVLNAIGTAAKWLYDTFIKPVVDLISTAWHWLYDNVIKPVSDWIKKAFDTVGQTSKIMYDSYVKPVVDAISGAWHWLYDNAIKPVGDWIGNAVHAVGQAFSNAFTWVKNIIKDVWDFIKPIFDAIGKAIGWVADKLGGIGKTIGSAFSGIAHFMGFDDGGFVPGAPGQPMLAVVHGGEYVVSNAMQDGTQAIDPKLGAQLTTSGGGIRASGGSSTGGGGNLVQIIVQGNAITERQLVDVVQEGMLRAGQRRPVTYQNYRR